ncbi:hypothetical protein [Pelagicoccus sp. SDUM812005]|uniref:hypothetical protein n=1 Tax=Pelagicoccus sp. SDUM812005 TaxID=3041257 RepID=UPI0028107FB1|nr:hypothetical protein [Pelagicoccus sp. SDUM812005]MDQ8182718.1 hypothetical protein [Pelagicoccus sp. SDUM812005]
MEFIKSKVWQEAENEIASIFKYKICPMCDVTASARKEEMELSGFSTETIIEEFKRDERIIKRFSQNWLINCKRKNYGDEWNPEEGNQQEDINAKLVGIGEGFLLIHMLFYLHAKLKPDSLLDFLKKRRIPHAKKTAKDIVKVFNESLNEKIA